MPPIIICFLLFLLGGTEGKAQTASLVSQRYFFNIPLTPDVASVMSALETTPLAIDSISGFYVYGHHTATQPVTAFGDSLVKFRIKVYRGQLPDGGLKDVVEHIVVSYYFPAQQTEARYRFYQSVCRDLKGLYKHARIMDKGNRRENNSRFGNGNRTSPEEINVFESKMGNAPVMTLAYW